MFTLEESALLGFMLRVSLGLVMIAVVAGCCAFGVHWMHAHHHHVPHPHLSLAARQA